MLEGSSDDGGGHHNAHYDVVTIMQKQRILPVITVLIIS